MKQFKLTAALFALCISFAKGQGPYAHSLYNHSLPAELGTGTKCYPSGTGFLMSSFRRTSTAGQFNFCVDRTDNSGDFAGTPSYSGEYLVSVALGCSGSTPIQNCYGVSSVANNPVLSGGIPLLSGVEDLIAGSTDAGVFFAGLDNTGSVISTGYYQFPASVSRIGKPRIVQFSTNSGAGTGHYYIAGSYSTPAGSHMYMLKIDDTGTLLNSTTNDYWLGQNTSLEVWDVMESPYAPSALPELVVVGWCDIGNANGSDGFLMRYDDVNQNVLNFTTYGNGGGGFSPNDFFVSINAASNTAATNLPGYIVGGYSDHNAAEPWMLFIDKNGAVGWSHNIVPSAYPASGRVIGVVERFHSVTMRYEYYGVATTASDMTAFKLDGLGNAYGGQDEFHYNYQPNSHTSSGVQSLTFVDDVGSFGPLTAQNEGLQIYGTNIDGSTSAFSPKPYLVMACFNGRASCNLPHEWYNSIQTTPFNTTSHVLTPLIMSPLGQCGANITGGATGPGQMYPCGFTPYGSLPAAGSNFRLMSPTGLKENTANAGISIYPNPASSSIELQVADAGDDLTLSLQNSLGQHIAQLSTNGSKDGRVTVDLNGLNLASGIYFIKASSQGSVTTQKLLIQKD